MNRSGIEQKVLEVIALQFGIELEEVNLDLDFIKDLNADSLDAVEVIMSVEDRFGIDVPDDDGDNLVNVKLVVDYVERKLKEKGCNGNSR